MAEAKPPRPRNVLLAEFPGLSKDDASQALRDTGGDLDRARKLIRNAKPHAREQPPTNVSSSLLLALPDDVLRRVIVGVLRDDHHVVASVCKVLRGVITDPGFLALRQRYGFAERRVVTINCGGDLQMTMAPTHTICTVATLPPATRLSHNGVTTDGHSRLFVSTWSEESLLVKVLAVTFWCWTPRPADGAVSQRCHGPEMGTAPCGMLASSTSLAGLVVPLVSLLILSMCTAKQLGCGRDCLRCRMPACGRRRASYAASSAENGQVGRA